MAAVPGEEEEEEEEPACQVAAEAFMGPPPCDPPPPPPGASVIHADDAAEAIVRDAIGDAQWLHRRNKFGGDDEDDDDDEDELSSRTSDDDGSEASQDAISVVAQAVVEEALETGVRQRVDTAAWARTIASAPCKHERHAWATTEVKIGPGPRSLLAAASSLCYRDADDSEVPEEEEEGGRATGPNVPSPAPPVRPYQDSPGSTNKELDQDGETPQEVTRLCANRSQIKKVPEKAFPLKATHGDVALNPFQPCQTAPGEPAAPRRPFPLQSVPVKVHFPNESFHLSGPPPDVLERHSPHSGGAGLPCLRVKAFCFFVCVFLLGDHQGEEDFDARSSRGESAHYHMASFAFAKSKHSGRQTA